MSETAASSTSDARVFLPEGMATPPIPLRPAIILFGDSLTQQGFGVDSNHPGWASLLSATYSRRADVLNRGYSGYNTRHAIDILPSVFGKAGDIADNTLFCTVFFGANDANLPGGRQHVPLDEYGENIETIIKFIRERLGSRNGSNPSVDKRSDNEACIREQQNNDVPIILITPPPVDQVAWDKFCDDTFRSTSNRTNDAARQYGTKVKVVGKRLGCPVLDAFQLMGGDDEDFGIHLSDGLHLSKSGNGMLYNGLMGLISREFPHLAPMFDGDGRYGDVGVPLHGKLWTELC